MTNEWICIDCAMDKGCEWPKGHLATAHEGRCGECGEIKTVTNIGDWNWPDGKRRGMRD